MTLAAMIIATSDRRAQSGVAAGLRAGGLGMTSMTTIMMTTWDGGAAGVR